MKVLARVMDKTGQVSDVEVNQDLGIKIEHKDQVYTISENYQGALLLRAMNNEIYIRPNAGNSVEIIGDLNGRD